MTIVYLKHQTLFQDPFMKSQCFVRSKFRPWSFGDTKTRKLIFIPKKAMTIKFQSILHKATEFHLIWPTFLWIMLCWKFCVENRSNFRTVRNIWRKFLLRVFTTTPKPITVPSMPEVPNTIHAVVLSRVSNVELENWKPCFIQFRVKVVRNTRFFMGYFINIFIFWRS